MCLCEEARRSNLLFDFRFRFFKLTEIVNELSNAESFDEKNPSKTNRLLRRTSSQ